MQNVVCYKYERKINDEVVAALQFSFDEMITRALDLFYKPTEFGRKIFIDGSLAKTVYPAISVMENMRFIYLCSLFEAFVKEYICMKSSTNFEEFRKTVLNKHSKTWEQYTNKNKRKRGTNSLLNFHYINFIFEKEYGFTIDDNLNDVTKEIGFLRNVVVHDTGEIRREFDLNALKYTLDFVGLPKEIGTIIKPTNKLMWIYINDMRTVISICDKHA